jgi:hypothetical protein
VLSSTFTIFAEHLAALGKKNGCIPLLLLAKSMQMIIEKQR